MSNLRVMVVTAIGLSLLALTGCPPAGTGPGAGGSGGAGGAGSIRPDSCGAINVNPVGRKLYSFLQASAELDRASIELENTVATACRRMADILGVSSVGNTRDVCMRTAAELDANLKVSVRSESRLVTRTVPPVCTTKIDLAAGFVAECEARAVADVSVTCEGRCSGTCNGTCTGTCAGGGTGGQCNGQCDGTCQGRCSGGCEGYANVEASAECKASAEVRASLRTECTEARVEVVRENVTIVDDSKFQKAMAAIDAGMPQLLMAGKKLELAGKAAILWAQTGASLVRASGQLVGQLGEKGVCVAGQLAAVAAATANIQARFSVSIEVSASVSASAGAQ
jgi:modification target Cys-rich repeat protein